MSSLNHTFLKRAGIVMSVLLLFVVIFVITTLFPPHCTLSAPYNNTNPIVFKCAGSITLSTPDNPDYFINTIDPSLHIFTPLLGWDKTPVLHLIIDNEFLPIKQNLAIPVPTIIPVTFFTESKEDGNTTISMIGDNGGIFNVSSIFTVSNISNIAFDGTYAISYLQKDPVTEKPQVEIYDLLAQTDTTFLKPLLGKDFEAFAPSGDSFSYAWQEGNPSGKSQIMVMSENNQLAINVNKIKSKVNANLTTPVYSGDGSELLSLEPETSDAVLYDLYDGEIKPDSPKLQGEIMAIGFTGEKKDVPFVASTLGIWFYQGSTWQFSSEIPNIVNVMCPSGTVHISPTDVPTNDCATLKIVTDPATGYNAIMSEYNGTTKKIYESKNKLGWVNESAVILQ